MKEHTLHRAKFFKQTKSENTNSYLVTSKWVYGGLAYNCADDTFNIVQFGVDGEVISYTVPKNTIGLSTTITDKNSTLVFEHDILKRDGDYFVVLDDHGILGVTPMRLYESGLWEYNTNWVTRAEGTEIIKSSEVVSNLVESNFFDTQPENRHMEV
jgi:hypothetical protein